MILFLGLFDLVAVLFSYAAIIFHTYQAIALGLLFFILLKGLWTLIVTRNIFDPLGLLDIIVAVSSYLAINNGLFANFALAALALMGLKSLFSMIKFG